MRRLVHLLIIAVMVTAGLAGCKSSEKNYREAYDLVIAKQQADREAFDEVDGILENHTNTLTNGRPMLIKVGDDTMMTRVEYVRMTPDAPVKGEKEGRVTHAPMERYNIVAGQFRQVFNARTMVDRLKFIGYDAFIVNTTLPTYYVIAGSYSMAIDAYKALKEFERDNRFTAIPPCPWVLQPTNQVR